MVCLNAALAPAQALGQHARLSSEDVSNDACPRIPCLAIVELPLHQSAVIWPHNTPSARSPCPPPGHVMQSPVPGICNLAPPRCATN